MKLGIIAAAYAGTIGAVAFTHAPSSAGAAAGISGPADWSYLSDNGLLSAVSLGRLAS